VKDRWLEVAVLGLEEGWGDVCVGDVRGIVGARVKKWTPEGLGCSAGREVTAGGCHRGSGVLSARVCGLTRARVTRTTALARPAGPTRAIHNRHILLLWSTTLAHYRRRM
jgi:hypothetical protein